MIYHIDWIAAFVGISHCGGFMASSWRYGVKPSHQATESEEVVASQQVDAANEDEDDSGNHDGESLPLDSDLWKNELLSPRKQIVLKKQPTDFNREEAYWQFMLITEALAVTDQRCIDSRYR